MAQMLQLFLVQELHKRNPTTSQSGFTVGAEKSRLHQSSVSYFIFFSYPNACLELGVVLCSDWVFETNL